MKTAYTVLVDLHHIAIIDLYQRDGTTWHIPRVNTPRQYRRQGYANLLFKELLADADRESITLTLDPHASGEMGIRALRAWYRRLGFIPQPGTPGRMIRKPKTGDNT